MRLPILSVLFLTSTTLFSQTPEAKKPTLDERYHQMKSNTQTFKEYKVIPEVMLDNEWRIVQDSILATRSLLNSSKSETKQLEAELQNAQVLFKEKDAATAENAYAADHIDFAGISFHKAVFVFMAVAITAGLTLLIVILAGRLKLMSMELKEKTSTAGSVALEFEEYKRKALEKQSKLSRELQTERNRLQELKKTA